MSSKLPLSPPKIHASIWNQGALNRISLVTVYRILKLLVDEGLVRKIVLPTGEFVYESGRNTNPRNYFLCRKCGGLLPLEPMTGAPSAGFVIPEGFAVEFQEHLLFGCCKSCLIPDTGVGATPPKNDISPPKNFLPGKKMR